MKVVYLPMLVVETKSNDTSMIDLNQIRSQKII